MLKKQHAAKLSKPVRAIFERAEDCFSVRDGEPDDVTRVVVGDLKGLGGVDEPFRAETPSEFKYEAVRDRETCQQHGP